MKVKCPTCKKVFEYRSSEFRPFCCERCKLVDLGQWFSESYGIPVEKSDEYDLDDSLLEIEDEEQ